jgi:uncharacterized membrane protein
MFIGDLQIAGILGAIEFFIKWYLYYLHDRAWGHFYWGKK